ncbi:MAG: ATPase, T2SS/T4P/T4SS family [Actinomycetota bacterium]
MTLAPLADSALVELIGDAVSSEINRRAAQGDVPLSTGDERRYARSVLRGELTRRGEAALAAGREPLDPDAEEHLINATLDQVFGFGGLERWIQDPSVQDVHVNGWDRVFIKTRDGLRRQVDPIAGSDEHLRRIIADFARRMGRVEQRFDHSNPIIDMQLPNGDRLNAMFSVSARPSLSIRRHDFSISSLDELRERGAFDDGVARFLRAAVRAKRNVIVSGGTGTGKTTLLRALINEIEPEERIVTVEDNLELGISRFDTAHPNLVECEARVANIEGNGAISMSDLVVASLRMDPDRIIVGECRGAETVPMLLAMSQGNDGSMTSMHADSSKNVFNRISTYAATLAQPPIDPGHANLLIRDAVHFVVHVGFAGGRRVVQSIREVDPTSEDHLLSTEVYAPGPDGVAVPAFGLTGRGHIAALAEWGFDSRWAAGDRRTG